ncbi:hypothetical protein GALL_535150 [mine drainage metagenome]|uniref:Uncharacterized protein n=1 Tax=mine drainage metagenome TaxID=410659 RepID=A0A1J5PMY6_9ZZZZ
MILVQEIQGVIDKRQKNEIGEKPVGVAQEFHAHVPIQISSPYDPGYSNDFCRQAAIVGVGPSAAFRRYAEATDARFASNADSSPCGNCAVTAIVLPAYVRTAPLWAGAAFQGFLARPEDVDSLGNCKMTPKTPACAIVRLH